MKNKRMGYIFVFVASVLWAPSSFAGAVAEFVGEPLMAAVAMLPILFAYFALILAIAVMGIFMISIPMMADIILAVASIFFPLAVVAYPINKQWAGSCFGAMVSAALTKAAAAFVLSGILGSGGGLQAAANKMASSISTSSGVGSAAFSVLGAIFGMIIIVGILITVVHGLSTIVASIFGGVSFGVPSFIEGATKTAAGSGASLAGSGSRGAKAVAGGAFNAAKEGWNNTQGGIGAKIAGAAKNIPKAAKDAVSSGGGMTGVAKSMASGALGAAGKSIRAGVNSTRTGAHLASNYKKGK